MSKHDDHKNGFTLLEVLIVLIIWSTLILLIVPTNFKQIEKQQEQSFFETLAFDILYTQTLSTTTKDYIQINLYEDHYTIWRGYGEIILTRDIPSGWVIKPNLFLNISFDHRGRIRKAGSFIIQTKNREYAVVFPFGKGRHHVVEQ